MSVTRSRINRRRHPRGINEHPHTERLANLMGRRPISWLFGYRDFLSQVPTSNYSLVEQGVRTDKGYESVRFVAFIVGHVLLIVGRM